MIDYGEQRQVLIITMMHGRMVCYASKLLLTHNCVSFLF